MSNQICVIIPAELREKARVLRINISEVARTALANEVKKSEKEVRESAAKQNPGPASTPHKAITNPSECDA